MTSVWRQHWTANSIACAAWAARCSGCAAISTASGAVSLDLHLDDDTARLQVEDRGPGFAITQKPDPGEGGMGLVAMRERCLLLGGQFTCHSQPGQGTRLLACIPRALADEESA